MGFCGTRDDALRVDNGVLQNECFVDVLNIVPHAIFLLVSVFILVVWNKSVLGQLHVMTWVHYQGHAIRWIVTLILLVNCLTGVGEGLLSDYMDHDTVNVHTFLPNCLAFLAAIGSIIYYHNVEQWNSPRFLLGLMAYWVSMVIMKFLKAFSLYANDVTHIHLRVWLTWIDVFLYVSLLVIELNVLRVQRYAFFKPYRRAEPAAELGTSRYVHDHVSFLSRFTYWWVGSILMDGYRHTLEMEDLAPLPKSEGAVTQYSKLRSAFEEEKYKASSNHKTPSFHKTYLRAFGPMLAVAGVLRLFGVLLAFIGPWCIEHIVDYAYEMRASPNNSLVAAHTYKVDNVTGNRTVYTQPHTQTTMPYMEVTRFFTNGYVLCVVLFLGTVLEHSLMQNHHYLVIREGVRFRAAVMTMIYTKTLKISGLVINNGKMTVGQIMNHMSMDTQFIMYLFFFIHFVWGAPLQIIVALVLMYYKLGWSAVIGGSLVIMSAPLQYFTGSGISKIQKKCMAKADKRVKKTNEVIQGISVIKLLAWEPFFYRNINETRKEELKCLYLNSLFRVLMAFTSVAIPAVGTMVAFLIYPFLESEPLTVGRAMSTLSLFQVLQFPCIQITHFITTFVNANVSVKRLLPFFLAEEVEGPGGRGAKTHTHSIGVEMAEMESIKLGMVFDVGNGTGKTSLVKDEDTSSLSSLESTYSRTPIHSRRGSHASLLDAMEPNRRASVGHTSSGSVLTVTEPPEASRRRHTSGMSTEDEEDVADVTIVIEPRAAVEVTAGNFSWHLDSKELTLKNINIKIPAGKLTIIVGPVGSGKSSLLSAILGEMVTITGAVDWNRGTRRAYVSQKPWLLNTSLKNNILFGQQFQWRRYNKVIQSCVLQPDIASLPAGDSTEIGEKGVNLSGGQKQRVSIARALYSKADTIILDDPLSALDAHVGKHVFEDAILKRLLRRKRTVILVTHHLQYLNNANHVIVMKEGGVQYQGKLADVKKVDPDLYESWRRALKEAKTTLDSSQKETLGPDKDSADHTESDAINMSDNLLKPEGHRRPSGQLLGSLSHRRLSKQLSNMEEETTSLEGRETGDTPLHKTDKGSKPDPESSGKLIKKEHRETGEVAMTVYMSYVRSCCPLLVTFVLLTFILYHTLFVVSNVALSYWTEAVTEFETKKTVMGNTTERFNNGYHMRLYSILNLSAIVGAMIASGGLYLMGIKASKVLHVSMLDTILHVPIRFFDTNPTGRILNRFSSDMSQIDQELPMTLERLMKSFFLTVSALIVNSLGTPYFVLAAVPLIVLYYCLQTFFRKTSRELHRLDNLTKSPIFSHFSETLNGLQTIRAYKAEGQFQCQAIKAINNNTTPLLFLHTINRWLGIRLDYIGAVLVLLASVSSLSASLAGQTTPAFVGLSITYALVVSFYLNWIVRHSAEIEMLMNSVERVDEYRRLEREPVRHPEGNLVLSEVWPEHGEVEFRDVSLRYEENLEPVVIGACFTIHEGEKIGICGRTGSGKSSLTLSLFRMIDISQGQILIDGKDTARISLPELRSKLAIIPQDPVLFSGTVRYNLAPRGDVSDEMIWLALENVQLKDTVAALPDQLDSCVSEGGENFSVGQKQLFCLARAFLRENKILILDEATASIDLETDNKLQDVISTAFKARTVITIAHRISTILKYDRVIVMDKGHIVELDTPDKLLDDPDSHFYSLVHNAKK